MQYKKSRRRRTTTLSNNAFATGDGNMFAERNVDVRFERKNLISFYFFKFSIGLYMRD